jgi:sirohydrochlorin cobaltochelatase
VETDAALLLMGHGSRDADGVRELRDLAEAVRARRAGPVACGVLEFAGPGNPSIQEAVDACVARGARRIVGQPLLLLCGEHERGDMPRQAELARERHPGLEFVLGGHLGQHDRLLEVVADRAREAEERMGGPIPDTALLLCARGSYRPEANACLFKVARLLWERLRPRRRWVEGCFVSLAPPSVPEGLRRCVALGARRVVVVPYFLSTGILVRRIAEQAIAAEPGLGGVELWVARHLGADGRVVDLILQRAREAEAGLAPAGHCCGCGPCRAPRAG